MTSLLGLLTPLAAYTSIWAIFALRVAQVIRKPKLLSGVRIKNQTKLLDERIMQLEMLCDNAISPHGVATETDIMRRNGIATQHF